MIAITHATRKGYSRSDDDDGSKKTCRESRTCIIDVASFKPIVQLDFHSCGGHHTHYPKLSFSNCLLDPIKKKSSSLSLVSPFVWLMSVLFSLSSFSSRDPLHHLHFSPGEASSSSDFPFLHS
ncbi:hypothetical protein L3Y34_017970 [Caenorhabditis briggsae]|uniref:Uncharacterized protein n=1 Tax=Caenorhabditis briggsae TaxID=6238 RepID=A0AAE9DKS2_CAEBR|nr:hypothetical protein L3Y34_017970 [Caenorhabditis briggsae]